MDKASIGNQAAPIEKHPEVRAHPHFLEYCVHLIFGHTLSETIPGEYSFSFGLVLGLADIALRRRSTLSLTRNCP